MATPTTHDDAEPSGLRPEDTSLAAFESRLGGYTKVPPERVMSMVRMSESRIRDELAQVSGILRRFAQAVVDSLEDPSRGSDFLRELDLRVVARDHDWRGIFSTLRSQGTGFEAHKRTLLIKYLQYLSFRKKLLAYIHARRAGLAETEEFPDLTAYPRRAAAAGAAAGGEEAWLDSIVADTAPEGFVRLPLGEPVTVAVPHARRVDMMLGSHLFRLIGTRTPCMVDQLGAMYFLKPGRNMVGRHPASDVVVDPSFRDVSRAHLIIEWSGGASELQVTDLSTRGTFVARTQVRTADPLV